jgi:hypothetical protein
MFLMNKFFDGEFMTFGLDVIRHMEADQEDRLDPMIYIFPRMTKCTFYKYGVSGEVSCRHIPQESFSSKGPVLLFTLDTLHLHFALFAFGFTLFSFLRFAFYA